MKRTCAAFTLIELLVVIGIIMVLIALMFPALSAIEERANKTKCLNNLRQIATAAVSQFAESREKLPFRGAGSLDNLKYGYAAGQLLPYLKYIQDVFKCPASTGFSDANSLITGSNPALYTDYEINGYLCAFGTGGDAQRRQNGITDYSVAAYAYDRPYYPFDESPHDGGINVAYLDGHAAWLRQEDMGNVQIDGDDGSEFYCKGHIFAPQTP